MIILAYAEFTQSLPDIKKLYRRTGLGKYAIRPGADGNGRQRVEVDMT